MKHIKGISKRTPALASTWQDIFCEVAGVVVGLLTAKGGSVPLLTFVNDKCQPNPIHEV